MHSQWPAVNVSPLIAVMKDQVRAMTQRNVSAVYAGGKRSVIFAVRSNCANAVKTIDNGCQHRDDMPCCRAIQIPPLFWRTTQRTDGSNLV